MNIEEFVKKTKPEIVKSIRIKIEDFSDVVLSEDDSIQIVLCDGEPGIFLGEFDMWYHIAGLEHLISNRASDSDFEYMDTFLTEGDGGLVAVKDIIKLIEEDNL